MKLLCISVLTKFHADMGMLGQENSRRAGMAGLQQCHKMLLYLR